MLHTARNRTATVHDRDSELFGSCLQSVVTDIRARTRAYVPRIRVNGEPRHGWIAYLGATIADMRSVLKEAKRWYGEMNVSVPDPARAVGMWLEDSFPLHPGEQGSEDAFLRFSIGYSLRRQIDAAYYDGDAMLASATIIRLPETFLGIAHLMGMSYPAAQSAYDQISREARPLDDAMWDQLHRVGRRVKGNIEPTHGLRSALILIRAKRAEARAALSEKRRSGPKLKANPSASALYKRKQRLKAERAKEAETEEK